MGFWGDVASYGLGGIPGVAANAISGGGVGDKIANGIGTGFQWLTGTGQYDPTQAARSGLQQVSQQATALGGTAGNYYNQGQQALNQQAAALQRTANGQNSVSALQLQQGLQQNLAAQQAQAASASPQNAAMAARTAAIQSGQLGAGLSGQQAMAGLQERNQAQSQLSGLLQNQFATNAGAATGAYNAAVNANSPQLQNPQKTTGQSVLGAAGGLLQSLTAISDRRLKTNIKDGSADAAKALSGLKAYAYDYKDPKYGQGRQLGVMAQSIEKNLPHVIIETPVGKAVHGGKLATALAAMLPGIDDRISKLEGSAKKGTLSAALAAAGSQRR